MLNLISPPFGALLAISGLDGGPNTLFILDARNES